MGKKSLIFLMLFLFTMSFISAEAIGQRQDAQLNQTYIISQPCATCTYINISVFNKNGVVLDNVEMTKNGSTWTYSFIPNETLRYDVNGIGDINGLNDSFAFFFDTTLSGEQTNTNIVIADILLITLLIGLMAFISIKYKGVDFDKWNKSIVESHENMGKTFSKGLIYGLMKNAFIWFYLLGWLVFFILKDMVWRFNSYEIYHFFVLFLDVYSFGFFLVMIILIGFFVKYMRDTVESLVSDSWGVE